MEKKVEDEEKKKRLWSLGYTREKKQQLPVYKEGLRGNKNDWRKEHKEEHHSEMESHSKKASKKDNNW